MNIKVVVKVDPNADWLMDGWTNGQKTRSLYLILLKAGATKIRAQLFKTNDVVS